MIRAAVVGAGNIGRHHARVYSGLADVELVAVVDPAPSSSEVAKTLATRHFETLSSALERVAFDVASVCVPTEQHVPVAKVLLDAGVSILVEKPVAGSIQEAAELARAAEAASGIVAVGQIERYNPVIRRVHELVNSGAVGDVLSIISKRVGGFPKQTPPTDVVLDLAVHDIDLMAHLVGSQCELLAAHGTRTFHTNEPDAAELLLRVGAASGFIQANWVTPVKIRTLSITGTRGYLEANYVTQELLRYELKVPLPQPTFTDFVRELGQPTPIVENVHVQEPLHVELESFVNAVRRNRPEDVVSIEEGTRAVALALDAIEFIRRDMGRAE